VNTHDFGDKTRRFRDAKAGHRTCSEADVKGPGVADFRFTLKAAFAVARSCFIP
jgi:hypothetical protein